MQEMRERTADPHPASHQRELLPRRSRDVKDGEADTCADEGSDQAEQPSLQHQATRRLGDDPDRHRCPVGILDMQQGRDGEGEPGREGQPQATLHGGCIEPQLAAKRSNHGDSGRGRSGSRGKRPRGSMLLHRKESHPCRSRHVLPPYSKPRSSPTRWRCPPTGSTIPRRSRAPSGASTKWSRRLPPATTQDGPPAPRPTTATRPSP
ncbi:hypothetical protein D3C86_1559390 [compost metagenome]